MSRPHIAVILHQPKVIVQVLTDGNDDVDVATGQKVCRCGKNVLDLPTEIRKKLPHVNRRAAPML
jgi:hypothetical protein